MNTYSEAQRLSLLLEKGGMMFFSIEKPARLYRGVIVLTAVKDNHRNRDVFIKEIKL